MTIDLSPLKPYALLGAAAMAVIIVPEPITLTVVLWHVLARRAPQIEQAAEGLVAQLTPVSVDAGEPNPIPEG